MLWLSQWSSKSPAPLPRRTNLANKLQRSLQQPGNILCMRGQAYQANIDAAECQRHLWSVIGLISHCLQRDLQRWISMRQRVTKERRKRGRTTLKGEDVKMFKAQGAPLLEGRNYATAADRQQNFDIKGKVNNSGDRFSRIERLNSLTA